MGVLRFEGRPWLEGLSAATPSANCFRVGGVLVDSGSAHVGAGPGLRRWLAGDRPELVALTHWHSDHTGGIAWLDGIEVAGHEAEVAAVNDWDPAVACDAAWIGAATPRYRVDRPLRDGDVIAGVGGGPELLVIHTGGQSPGHVAYLADDVLLTGDLLQRDDVAWMPPRREALEEAIAALERFADIGPKLALSGHGPVVDDPARAIERNLARYQSWRDDPERWFLHGARRLVATHVALRAGLSPVELGDRAAGFPGIHDLAGPLGTSPREVALTTIDQLIGSGAAVLKDGGVHPGFDYLDPTLPSDLELAGPSPEELGGPLDSYRLS